NEQQYAPVPCAERAAEGELESRGAVRQTELFAETRQLLGLGSEACAAEQLPTPSAGEGDVSIGTHEDQIGQRASVDRDAQGFARIIAEPKQIRAASDHGLWAASECATGFDRGYWVERLPEQGGHRHASFVAGRAQRDLAFRGDALGAVVHFERGKLALVDLDGSVLEALAAVIRGEGVGHGQTDGGILFEARIALVVAFSRALLVVEPHDRPQ